MKPYFLTLSTLRNAAWSVLIATSFLSLSFSADQAEGKSPPLSVAVSIKPLQSLIWGLMDGTGSNPMLIVPSGASPHTYSLKPSDARKISNADMIFWIGPGIEKFLEKPLRSLAGKADIVTFLPEKPTSGEQLDTPLKHNHEHHGASPHIWLSPINAIGMVNTAAARLAKADPGNADLYGKNAVSLVKRLKALQDESDILLSPVKSKPFLVFHDAYDHMAKAFGLNIVGMVTISPERAPGARRIADLRKLMETTKTSCLFGEPQVDSSRLNVIVENIKNARIGVLDPLGAGIPAGKDMYFKLMRTNVRALVNCLSAYSTN